MDYQQHVSEPHVARTGLFRSVAQRISIPAVLALLLLGMGLWNLDGPQMWWDEGWTLSTARTWLEHGHYGRLQAGELAPAGLSAAFPTVAGTALGMKLFGVGIWQGRLFGVVCMVIALLALAYLATRLHSRAVAGGTLVLLLLLTMHPQLHPLIQGRQVLAELPSFCFLLGGYLCLAGALRGRWWWLWLLAACVFWGIALDTKAQVKPFWMVSVLVPLLAVLATRQWKAAAVLALGTAGTLLFGQHVTNWLMAVLVQRELLQRDPIHGLLEVIAVVPYPDNRMLALRVILLNGLPALLGMLYVAWRYGWRWWQERHLSDHDIVLLAVLALAGSWFGWFALLSAGTPRYLFPATFFGSLFAAIMLYDLTDGYSLRAVLDRVVTLLKSRQAVGQGLVALLLLLLVPLMLSITFLTFRMNYLADDDSAEQVARFFNTQTPPGTLVETYASELHFLLDRPYHYPPDQVHIELNRRTMLLQDVTIDYDPLAADPDYLVTGEYTQRNDLYEPVIESGAFRLLRTYGHYEVYERVR